MHAQTHIKVDQPDDPCFVSVPIKNIKWLWFVWFCGWSFSAYGALTVRSLLDTREQYMNEFQFPDPYAKVQCTTSFDFKLFSAWINAFFASTKIIVAFFGSRAWGTTSEGETLMSFLDFILFFIFTFIYFYFYFHYLFIFSFVNAKFLVNLRVFASSPSCVLFISAFQFCTRCCLPFPTLQSSHPLPSPPHPTPLTTHTSPSHNVFLDFTAFAVSCRKPRVLTWPHPYLPGETARKWGCACAVTKEV